MTLKTKIYWQNLGESGSMLSKSISMAQWANKSHLNLSTAGDQYLSSYYSSSIFIFSFGCDHKPHDSNYCQVLARKTQGLGTLENRSMNLPWYRHQLLVPLHLITIMRPRVLLNQCSDVTSETPNSSLDCNKNPFLSFSNPLSSQGPIL